MKRLDDFLQGIEDSSQTEGSTPEHTSGLGSEDDSSGISRKVSANHNKPRGEVRGMNGKSSFTFAHMADCHLGAFRDERLRELNLKAFERSFDICIERDVEFIVISGDLFHRSFPALDVVKRAVEKMKEAVDQGIRIYMIYGSHDYAANTVSLIDVLGSAGLFKKVFIVDSEANLTSVIDEETGAELMGISGRTQALEREYYPIINAVPKGKFSIFLFHTAISELRPPYIPQDDSIPMSLLPQGFDYYAGGHVHEHLEQGNIFYPGPLFGSDFRDLSNGEEKGFYLVDVDGKSIRAEFVPIKVADLSFIELDVSGMDGNKAAELLKQKCSGSFRGIVLMGIHGRLRSGSVADLDIEGVKRLMEKNGAERVITSTNVTTEEKPALVASGNTREEIENRLFTELFGSEVKRARELFSELSIDPEELDMKKQDFEKSIEDRGFRFFGLEDEDDN